MKKPQNIALVPAKGWTLDLEPDGLGPPIASNNWSEFIVELRKRLDANGRLFHGWRDHYVDLMCQQRPDIPQEDDEEPKTRAMTGEDVLRFMKTMWASLEAGVQPVSEELQNQRVEVCLQCPKLGFISCFTGCGSLSETLSKFIIGRTIRRIDDVHKKSCMACGCSAEIKTMWPVELLREVDAAQHATPPDYHPSCWILNENQNMPMPESSSAQPAEAETN